MPLAPTQHPRRAWARQAGRTHLPCAAHLCAARRRWSRGARAARSSRRPGVGALLPTLGVQQQRGGGSMHRQGIRGSCVPGPASAAQAAAPAAAAPPLAGRLAPRAAVAPRGLQPAPRPARRKARTPYSQRRSGGPARLAGRSPAPSSGLRQQRAATTAAAPAAAMVTRQRPAAAPLAAAMVTRQRPAAAPPAGGAERAARLWGEPAAAGRAAGEGAQGIGDGRPPGGPRGVVRCRVLRGARQGTTGAQRAAQGSGRKTAKLFLWPHEPAPAH
jgi:hypothetical protein